MRVKVVRRADDVFNKDYMFRTGVVIGFDETECAASSDDPMIIVYFDVGVKSENRYTGWKPTITKQDAFWSEELEIIQ